jgi:hypothetical protein
MTSAPRPRPALLVIEGGRGHAANLRSPPSEPRAAPASVPPSHRVIEFPQVSARRQPDHPPCEMKLHWCLGVAAAGVFLTGLSVCVMVIAWTGGALMQP